ncbi:aminoacyl-histidine dipeptidase [Echinimonas agarilytica]|uniref:Cytosol non-specific dipeptidase n=1 Tax=Echinimonas agarilytica TaxID=1215918 RepID=A0AA42B7K9_9GAMM|nr:aminoacyl-histidine dipeptidase [Echinimonas agarilytica]MCM2680260.1 aminoacyl-histidine dipeptidase [Echinimonas agarilytica]
MGELSTLKPQQLWNFFETICSIPHPSKHEEQLATWICDWATQHDLCWQRDEVGNVIIKKPAASGFEHLKTVVLQAHIDMVPQKEVDSAHIFETDPIEPIIDGEWLTANKTTLGADNGIGMASCLAVLASTDIQHGPLEVLLTIDEEAGMTGAFGLQPGMLEGSILINTDSEQEGEVYMGCAGGVDTNISFPITRCTARTHKGLEIKVGGLRGGHSGVNIHLGRGNANKVLTRILCALQEQNLIELESFNGGSLRNAIPRDASAFIKCDEVLIVKRIVAELAQTIKSELRATDPDLTITVEQAEVTNEVLSFSSLQTFLLAIQATFNGVFAMSQEIDEVTETSSNLGVVATEQDSISVLCLVRSLLDSARFNLQQTIQGVWKLAGAEVVFSGAYPGWAPNNDSAVMALVRTTYEEVFQRKPEVMVIHAGLECGLFKTAYPNLDMVSIGPTIRFPHSPDEKVHIGSVDLYWQLLVKVLEAIPAK